MKSGFVSIVGRPNAGKSTLLNAITGEKIAAISDKPQTTRNTILGIITDRESQVVFMDTPGIHKPKTKLGEFMIKQVDNSVKSVDMIVVVTDACDITDADEDIAKSMKDCGVPVLLVINKIDVVEKEKLLEIIARFSATGGFDEIIPISALKKDGVGIVLDEIKKRLEDGPMYYPDDYVTDQPEKNIAAEIIREKALWCLDKEVPHGIAVEIEKFKETENGRVNIGAVLYCEKKSHKGIIIGKNGAMLKKIGTLARRDIERFLGTEVFLETWVKVKEDWRNSDFLLKNFGFDNQ